MHPAAGSPSNVSLGTGSSLASSPGLSGRLIATLSQPNAMMLQAELSDLEHQPHPLAPARRRSTEASAADTQTMLSPTYGLDSSWKAGDEEPGKVDRSQSSMYDPLIVPTLKGHHRSSSSSAFSSGARKSTALALSLSRDSRGMSAMMTLNAKRASAMHGVSVVLQEAETLLDELEGIQDEERSNNRHHRDSLMALPFEDSDDDYEDALRYRSLFLFEPHGFVRTAIYKITHHRAFEVAVLLIISFNCVCLAFDNPSAQESQFLVISEIVCNTFFTLEMFLKVIAEGLVLHPHSYLRSPWNKLDTVIVVMGWIALLPSAGNFTGIRIIRVLRPLRSINGIQGLKNIVNALLLSVRGLMHVLLLIIFFFTTFGILGVQLFKGMYRRRCVDPATGLPPEYPLTGQFCRDTSHVLLGRSCPSRLECREYENPESGFISFDHFGWAALVIFRCITLEGWVQELYRVLDLAGVIAIFYFFPVVILGSFFILNLSLAVVSEQFRWTNEIAATQEIRSVLRGLLESEEAKAAAATAARERQASIDAGGPQPDADAAAAAEEDAAEPPLPPRRRRLRRMRLAAQCVTEHGIFQWTIVVCIFLNTGILAAEHDGQSHDISVFMSVANVVLTGIFTAELVLKLFATGLRQYLTDNFNILDGTIVVISFIDVTIDSGSSVTVFRSLRLLRVLKLVKNFQSLRQLITVVLHAVQDTGYLNVLIFLYLYVSSLCGTQLFAGSLKEDGESPRANFDTFYWSLLTVVQVLTRDDWTTPMWSAMRGTSPAACIYFICLVLFGDFIILNLFLAILINSFESNMIKDAPEGMVDAEDTHDAEALVVQLSNALADAECRRATLSHSIVHRRSITAEQNSDRMSIVGLAAVDMGAQAIPPNVRAARNVTFASAADAVASTNDEIPDGLQQMLGKGRFAVNVYTASGMKIGGALNAYAARTIRWQRQWPSTNGGNSLFLFGATNTFRVWCTWLVNNQRFEGFILFAITASSVLLAVEDPTADTQNTDPLGILNIFFTALFVCEMMMKILAFGLIKGEGAYLRDGWNVLDAVVVAISVMSMVLVGFKFVKVFRALRTLRPLRVVNRNVGLKIVVRCLLRTLPQISNVAVVVGLIFFVFGILGVQLFGGRLHYCSDPTVKFQAECVGVDPNLYLPGDLSSLNALPVARRWRNRDQNFDNIIQALLTLVEVSSLELWTKIMYTTIDGKAKGEGPDRDSVPLAGLYFVMFVIVGSFFVFNLFVGVVIYNYNLEKKLMEGKGLLTAEQEKWIEVQRLMLTFRPNVQMPFIMKGPRRITCVIANSKAFEFSVYAVIAGNAVIMGLERYPSTSEEERLLGTMNTMCSGFFVLEAMIKLHAWRLTYFRNNWNRYDLALVLVAIATLPLEATGSGGSSFVAVKLFRLLRLIRLLKSSRGMRLLIETLWYSLPYLSNIFLFLGLLFFIYAALGVHLFHGVRKGDYLTYHANFDNFVVTLLLLFRISTGEEWNGLMHDLMVSPPDCRNEADPVTGEPADCLSVPFFIPPIYFISFLCIAAQVMMNLFIAVILDNFSTTIHIEKSRVGTQELNRFVALWGVFDPSAELLIPTSRFPHLLSRLGPPLGVKEAYTRLDLLKQAGQFEIIEHGGLVHFIEVLIPLARLGMGVQLSDADLRQQESSWRDDFPDIRRLPTLRYRQQRVTVVQFFAATYIAAAYKRRVARCAFLPLRDARRRRYELYWRGVNFQDKGTQTDPPAQHIHNEVRAAKALALAFPAEVAALAKARVKREKREDEATKALRQHRHLSTQSPQVTVTSSMMDDLTAAERMLNSSLEDPLGGGETFCPSSKRQGNRSPSSRGSSNRSDTSPTNKSLKQPRV